MRKEYFKTCTLSPTATIAGGNYEFVVTLIIGRGYTPGASRLVFDFPGTLGMSRPALLHREEPGFVEAYVSSAEVPYKVRIWDMEINDFATKEKTSWRGMGARTCVLDFGNGLKEGDVIELHWGDMDRGYGPGTRVTHVVPRPDYQCTIHVRYYESHNDGIPYFGRDFKGHNEPVPVAEMALPFTVSPLPAKTLQLIRTAHKAILVPRDPYWNVADVKDPDELVISDEGAVENSQGVYEFSNRNIHVKARTLPLLDSPPMDDVFDGYNLYWGDMHTHSCYSVDCIQREKMEQHPGDLMIYARERAGLDFCAITDHHEPWNAAKNHIGGNGWNDLLEAVRTHDRQGEFLAFPGFEYRCRRGDTSIIFKDLPAYSDIDHPEWDDITKVWAGLAGKDYLSIPHFHNPGSLDIGEWLENSVPGFEPVLEIFSCHGSYETSDALELIPPLMKSKRIDRYGSWFLGNGYRYGFVANSDGHKGVIGTNGVTAVFAKSLDRESIFDAYRKRHVYGTSNARIRLLFTVNDHLMGSVVPRSEKNIFFIDVHGESELKKVELFRNGGFYQRFIPAGKTFTQEVRVEDDESANWHVRVTQKDNHIAWSSPVWFED